MEAEEEIADTETPITTENIKGNVEFKNVSFGYNMDKIIINNFNTNVCNGKRLLS